MPDRKDRSDPSKSLVGFIVGDVSYAVEIDAVREIVNPAPMTALPHLPASIAGVADHRGEVIPIIDLRARFDLSPLEDQRQTKWVLVRISGQSVGLIVDRVTEVFGTGGDQMQSAPSLGDGDEARGIAGVISHEGVLTFVLDVDRFEALTAAIPQSLLLDASPAEPGS